MGFSFRLCPASAGDLGAVVKLIEDAARWLRTKDTTQWERPWPSREARDRRILVALLAGETWILWDGHEPVATISASLSADAALWSEADRREPAIYLRRLVVNRRYAGMELGALLLDWAGVRALHERGIGWMRIDVWADNHELHDYYRERGFEFVRWCTQAPEYPAGALFQKDARSIRAEPPVPFAVEAASSGPLLGRSRGKPHQGRPPGARAPRAHRRTSEKTDALGFI